MNVPAQILLQARPDADCAPLLQTVFEVLESVATANSSSVPTFRNVNAFEPDHTVDNVGENLSTLSPQPSPLSSPTKNVQSVDSSQQRLKTTLSESDDNVKAVRLASKMVKRNI